MSSGHPDKAAPDRLTKSRGPPGLRPLRPRLTTNLPLQPAPSIRNLLNPWVTKVSAGGGGGEAMKVCLYKYVQESAKGFKRQSLQMSKKQPEAGLALALALVPALAFINHSSLMLGS